MRWNSVSGREGSVTTDVSSRSSVYRVKCVFEFQSNSAESDIVMNCGENISEAGPTTAANIDGIHNIPCKLHLASTIYHAAQAGGGG